ncbi:Leucine aminopeptidase 1 [Chytridiales sp. JEL 0842]|nr:Leucine aminopeptidase 1 [Chytridiales sp. JEL 0842]
MKLLPILLASSTAVLALPSIQQSQQALVPPSTVPFSKVLSLAQPASNIYSNPLNVQMRDEGFRLISTAEGQAEWMDEAGILGLIRMGKKFIDVTDLDLERVQALDAPKSYAPPTKVAHKSIVEPMLKNVSIPHMTEFLTEFSSFKTRYYQSASGKESAQWLFDQVSKLADAANSEGKVKVSLEKFEHAWTQFSIIVRVEAAESAMRKRKSGRKAQSEEVPVVVLGAHQDSVNMWNPYWGRSPGADDDGSGSTTIFEALRVLLTTGFVPGRPIEFHWYSAEEGGLLGSQKVVADYKSRSVPVAGVLHSDMTGYQHPDKEEVLAVNTDNVDPEMTQFYRILVDAYSGGVKWYNTACGYACSDHASWTKGGYKSAFTFEGDFKNSSPYIHTTNDDVSHISFPHMAKFVKVAIAFAVELSLAK